MTQMGKIRLACSLIAVAMTIDLLLPTHSTMRVGAIALAVVAWLALLWLTRVEKRPPSPD